MSDLKRLEGQRFGRLVVVSRLGSTMAGQARWLARCDCGGEARTAGQALRDGRVVSCGCAKRGFRVTHGNTRNQQPTAEYTAWANMKARCRPGSDDRHLYFDRGISVCPEWERSFEGFLLHVGLKPNDDLSIDRIDNDRGYEPGNVRWATATEQRMNQRGMKEAT